MNPGPSKTAPGIAPGCVRLVCYHEQTCKEVGFCCARSDSQELLREFYDVRHAQCKEQEKP